MSGSSGQRNIAQSQIRKFICAHPAIEEQTLIDTRLSAIERTLSEEVRTQSKLQKQKLGLMQDLLTGKVPVTVDASPSETAA
jgi:type I restriction enzyme S subunit